MIFTSLLACAALIGTSVSTPQFGPGSPFFNNPSVTSLFSNVPTDPAAATAFYSSIYKSLVAESKIPGTLTAPPFAGGTYGPGNGPWAPGAGPGNGKGPGPGAWGGASGWGPFGSASWGPWSEWSTRSDWRNGPWTSWWAGSACPGTDWPGWTQGPWSTNPPWTSWAGCTAKTTSTSLVTATVSGKADVQTQYGIQVAAASSVTKGSGEPGSSEGHSGAAASVASLGLLWWLGSAVILGLAVGL